MDLKQEAPIDLEKQRNYIETINKVVVKYGDGSRKKFKGAEWFLFEDQINRNVNCEFKVYYKRQFPFLLSDILSVFFGGCLFYNPPGTINEFFSQRLILFILFLVLTSISILQRSYERR